MCFCVFWERNMVTKERKNCPERCPSSSQNVSLQSELPGAFYRPWYTFWGPVHLVGAPAALVGALGWAWLMSAISSLCTFSVLTLVAHLEVFPDLDWSDLGVPGKIWMSSFQKTKYIKIKMVGSKVMTLGSVLMCISQFSKYLNRFNSDFSPWIVIGMGIWLSSQWHWSQLVLMTR